MSTAGAEGILLQSVGRGVEVELQRKLQASVHLERQALEKVRASLEGLAL